MESSSWTAVLLTLFAIGGTFALPADRDRGNSSSTFVNGNIHQQFRRDRDPTSFAWVHRLAAIGDSFTAGIGSGNQLGSLFNNQDDWKCSRYDMSYPVLVNNLIGPSIDDFQFPACSGDRSVQIYDQVQKLKGDVNLLIMTAGGNDLCLAGMIKKCVMLPFEGEATCDAVIDKAQENINSILKPNLKEILKSLDGKMAKDGIVVYNGYARFFNTENDACAKDQKWHMDRWLPKYWFKSAIRLTIERRKRFNKLVDDINAAIRTVVEETAKEVKYTIGFSNWDPWPIDGVKGQMCDPISTGRYPDPKQPDLQFFKPNTYIAPVIHDELKRRAAENVLVHDEKSIEGKGAVDKRIYDSLLWKSPHPRAVVLHKLNRRAPSPPNCPGDNDWIDPTLGLGLPDSFGKLFHPNELGHQTIASFALAKTIDLRAKVLGIEPQTCEIADEFKCWQKEGRKGYATADKLNENYKDFCEGIQQPEHEVGWKSEKTYFKDTPDEQSFLVQLGPKTAKYKKDECMQSFERIIHGCDGNDPNNPLNWKFGGRWTRGEYTYELNIKRNNRPWPVIKEPYGKCNGDWKVFGLHSSYEIRGAGFSSWDYGQKTILPSMKGCLGLGITAWEFDYFKEPDKDGMEWKSTFNTPVWVRARCFNNNKVVKGAGGYTNGCSGSDW
ncbi:hypothetical protein LOZ66_006276 [Ophidiomyces ophidiicola]|nr:hypothetical protein LOZ65_000985 [Ophidiomyces ophidiicola]KAI1933768.1 hypothetical protein LOZ66_006276 [Ophidiomyces ophidiicola]